MQTKFANFLDFSKKFMELNGIKYLVEQKNYIFFIYKVEKKNDKELLLDFLNIFFGTIYKGTTFCDVYKIRVLNFLFYINESLFSYLKRRKFSVVEGFKMKSEDEMKSIEIDETKEDKEIADFF